MKDGNVYFYNTAHTAFYVMCVSSGISFTTASSASANKKLLKKNLTKKSATTKKGITEKDSKKFFPVPKPSSVKLTRARVVLYFVMVKSAKL